MPDPAPAPLLGPEELNAKYCRNYIRLARVALGLLCPGSIGSFAYGLSLTTKL